MCSHTVAATMYLRNFFPPWGLPLFYLQKYEGTKKGAGINYVRLNASSMGICFWQHPSISLWHLLHQIHVSCKQVNEGFSFRLIQGNSTRRTFLNNSGILSYSGINTVLLKNEWNIYSRAIQMLNITVVLQIIISPGNTDFQHQNGLNKWFQVLCYPLPEQWESHASNCNIAVDAIFIETWISHGRTSERL